LILGKSEDFSHFDGHQKNGFFAVDLDNYKTRLPVRSLAKSGTSVWGNHRLKQVTATDVLVIDEMGPLEFGHSRVEDLAAGMSRFGQDLFLAEQF
jgi:hypothetical protein